ncbi:MAG: DUF4038 domain-containing protein [Bacteroidota bacterium]|nr:DUF4038 domain-containing protein [Bacteroidota bacterium]
MGTKLQPFLADTLWFGMTSRISLDQLKDYANIRTKQGFNAVQIVVGIPPEVGPKNKNASGESGPAWDLEGNFNFLYLEDCEKRVKLLNNTGLKVIIYGAWGHHINWLGIDKMKEWWEALISRFEKYNVLFCLTGESNIWIGNSASLLPDKTTRDFKTKNKIKKFLEYFPFNILRGSKILKEIDYLIDTSLQKVKSETMEERKNAWSQVAQHVSQKTKFPLFIHTTHVESSLEAINNPNLLAAVTTQTSHSKKSKNRHWQEPLSILNKNPKLKFINLEPWYEGILNKFFTEDQLFAYWANMMSGAYAYCYGAHGIWNCGDGDFLSQWGKQTFDDALKLKSPDLIGKSHKFFMDSGAIDYPYVDVEAKNDELISICRKNEAGDFLKFYPKYKSTFNGKENLQYFNPLRGMVEIFPAKSSPMVIKGKSSY